MAELDTTQYASAHVVPITQGGLHVNVYGAALRWRRFTYTQSGAGTIGDTIRLIQVPANCVIVVPMCRFQFTAWDTNANIQIGWDAHETPQDATVAADPNGLIASIDVDAIGEWFGGMTITAGGVTRVAPATEAYEVNSKEPVVIRATNDTAAAGDADTFNRSS